MRDDVEERFPEEACGLLAGTAGRVLSVIPVTNTLNSPVRYQMDPHEQLRAFIMIEENRWELTAIYHSHPHGPDRPSKTDIEESYYPDSVYFIWFKKSVEWYCKGFYIQDGSAISVPIKIIEDQ